MNNTKIGHNAGSATGVVTTQLALLCSVRLVMAVVECRGRQNPSLTKLKEVSDGLAQVKRKGVEWALDTQAEDR